MKLSGNQKGFSLLEVLIALVVFSIGMLGLLALQSSSTVTLSNSQSLSDAVVLAQDMADRLRANSDEALTGAVYNGASAASESSKNCASGCSAAERAQKDVNDWFGDITTQLPGGGGSLSRTGSAFIVSVTWQDRQREDGAATVNGRFDLRVEL
ncbi:type IV pilus modification protein PilV [Marinobacterium jannaschii]|uniref:type IV pilus modification protein PilV n=1 Tax=Marinobacterium jannaschii TaxID=64970 RepID=UPI00068733DE|nr:type IV pilus modification protein PilV [Marinobacterium jannaschii]